MKIKFKSLDQPNNGIRLAVYNCKTDLIALDITRIVLCSPECFTRRIISTFVHELTHWIEWHFISRHNLELWHSYDESKAEYIEHITNKILGIQDLK